MARLSPEDSAEFRFMIEVSPRCGWTGLACRCTEFPWKRDGAIPATCVKRRELYSELAKAK
jgi:hypothetical protein